MTCCPLMRISRRRTRITGCSHRSFFPYLFDFLKNCWLFPLRIVTLKRNKDLCWRCVGGLWNGGFFVGLGFEVWKLNEFEFVCNEYIRCSVMWLDARTLWQACGVGPAVRASPHAKTYFVSESGVNVSTVDTCLVPKYGHVWCDSVRMVSLLFHIYFFIFYF